MWNLLRTNFLPAENWRKIWTRFVTRFGTAAGFKLQQNTWNETTKTEVRTTKREQKKKLNERTNDSDKKKKNNQQRMDKNNLNCAHSRSVLSVFNRSIDNNREQNSARNKCVYRNVRRSFIASQEFEITENSIQMRKQHGKSVCSWFDVGLWVAPEKKATVLVGLTNCTVCVQSLRLAFNVWMLYTLHGAFVGFARRHQSCQHGALWIRATLGGMRFAHACSHKHQPTDTKQTRNALGRARCMWNCTRIWRSLMKLQTPASQPNGSKHVAFNANATNIEWHLYWAQTKIDSNKNCTHTWMSRVFPAAWIIHLYTAIAVRSFEVFVESGLVPADSIIGWNLCKYGISW